MSTTHTVKLCAACGAPAVHGHAECWSCGKALALPAAPSAAAAPIPPPEEYIRPCPRCGGACAVYLSQCPSCGAPLGRAARLLRDVLSRSVGEQLPDGTIRLQIDPMPPWMRLPLGLIVVTLMAYLCYSYITTPQFHKTLRDLEEARVLGALGCLGLVTYAVVGAVSGDEVWEVGADRLVIRKALFGRKWTRQYTGATLQVETREQVRGGQITSLVVHAAEGRATLASARLLGTESIRTMGAFLSRVTGWPLRDDAREGL
jgi:hypothetical protein